MPFDPNCRRVSRRAVSAARAKEQGPFAGSGTAVAVCLTVLLGLASGCRVLDEKTTSAVSTPGLAILAAFHPSGGDHLPPDLSLLKPAGRSGGIGAGDVVDCTVWDLYEPGEPHTFPLRIGPDRSLDLPLAGRVVLSADAPAEIEKQIEQSYRQAGVLRQPRVVVRSLEQAELTVRVTGAVIAPGEVRLTRDQATVYATIAQAGGLKPTAGKQIGLIRPRATSGTAPIVRGQSENDDVAGEPPRQSAEPKSAPAESLSSPAPVADSAPKHTGEATPSATTPPAPAKTTNESKIDWYDLSIPGQAAALRDVRLQQGDEVVVSTQLPPVRVLGSVGNPGTVSVNDDQPRTVADVLAEAGGIRTNAWPVVVTLYRPPSERQRARQYSWTLADSTAPLDADESLLPGDILHVAPTTGTRIKSVVGLFWKKPATD